MLPIMRHPGDYRIAQHSINLKFYRIFPEDYENLPNYFVRIEEGHPSFYQEDGMLLPEYWILLRWNWD